MKVILRWDCSHLDKAVANMNTHNPHVKDPLSVNDMEKLIISTFSSPESLEGLTTTIYGVMFTPELVPYQDLEQDEYVDLKEEYLTIFLHISIPVMYEFTEDVREVTLFDVPDFEDEIILQ